jgi:hypothetical protein
MAPHGKQQPLSLSDNPRYPYAFGEAAILKMQMVAESFGYL